MTYQDFLIDAIEIVLAWDLPDEVFREAVTDRARLMAGLASDEIPVFTQFH